MRRIQRLVFIMISLSIGFYSCQKELTDPTGSTTTPGGTGDFRATINGTLWVANLSQGARQNGRLVIEGQGGGKLIAITLADAGSGHYVLDSISSSGSAAAYSDSASGSNVAFATNGGGSITGGTVDITIDTVNKRFSGTFQFKVFRAIDTAQRNITLGSFTNVSYATTTPPASSTDTFNVKIDGTAFASYSVIGLSIPLLNQIEISGLDQAGTKSVTVYVPNAVVPGTYSIGTIGDNYYGQYNRDASTFLISDTGTLTILEHNTSTKRIRGSFNFHAKQFAVTNPIQAQLTLGYFAVTYQ